MGGDGYVWGSERGSSVCDTSLLKKVESLKQDGRQELYGRDLRISYIFMV